MNARWRANLVRRAPREASAGRDVTSRVLLPANRRGQAALVAGGRGVVCGLEYAARAFRLADPSCRISILSRDGMWVSPGRKVLEVRGRLARLLSAERTALNFLGHLSGVATLTRRYVRAVRHTGAKILDTRKTIPGLRYAQKYAVLCGGGLNHRPDLSSMAMVKDNHLEAIRGDKERLLTLKSRLPRGTRLVVEAKNSEELDLALSSRADIVLLDNMTPGRLKAAVRKIIRSGAKGSGRPEIEVSGRIKLSAARAIARSGVDRISVGALTHSARALDFSMDIERVGP